MLDGPVADQLRDARVTLVDDAVSTGDTMRSLSALLADAGSDVVARAAVFEEGREHPETHTLASLPLFTEE